MALTLAEIAAQASASNAQDNEEYVSSGSNKIENSGAYICKINMAKVVHADSGAVGMSLELQTEDETKVYITEYFVSGNTKGNKTTYTDKDGNEINLPGFSKVKALNFLLTGVSGLPNAEMKEVKEYDYDLKQEVSVNREVVLSWLNKSIGVCVQLSMEDKYNDETQTVTKIDVEHFFDPVTDQFSSEKISSKASEMKAIFLSRIEKTPIKDKRKKSKDSTPNSSNKSKPLTTKDAGF